MKYKNIKTGFVFESNAKCEGADYILITEEKSAPKGSKKKKKAK